MKSALAALALIVAPVTLQATPAAAQQDPAERARIDELTRRLNGALPAPRPASVAAPAPVSPPPSARPAANMASPVVAPPPPPAAAQNPPLQQPASEGLGAAERAALPFRLDLPSGFDLVAGRAAPGAHVYSVRRAGKTYLMIYTGPSSQFPIYDGDQVTVGGRLSIVATEGHRRIALEHLFQRATDPAEIHVWLMAQDGPDRDEAERIAQTVDPR